MSESGNSLIIEQKATLPNPFDSSIEFGQSEILPAVVEANNMNIVNEDSISYAGSQTKSPNFPSFLPIIYHNIDTDISVKYVKMVRLCFLNVVSFSFVSLFSLFFQFFSYQIDSYLIVKWRELLLSFLICLVCPILLFYVQYYPLYCAARDERGNTSLIPLQFFIVFLFFFFFVGVPGTGVVGVGYLCIAWSCGSLLNKLYAFVATVWHFLNFIMQFLLLLLMHPLGTGKTNRALV